MDFEKLREAAETFVRDCPANYIAAEDAIRPELAGMQIFDAPLLGVAAADDPMFIQLQSPEVVAPDVMLPGDWLPEAKSVLSIFLPYTEAARISNRGGAVASDEWLHVRSDGKLMAEALCAFLREWLEKAGYAALCPAVDPRCKKIAPLTFNWSERHVAHICGLGTFGLSKVLITEKGVAGWLGSLVTSAPLPVTQRPYSDPFEYCTMCGKCAKNCPSGAIDPSRGVIHGKDKAPCAARTRASELPPHGPRGIVRYGCGKCQVDVPCERGIPGR